MRTKLLPRQFPVAITALDHDVRAAVFYVRFEFVHRLEILRTVMAPPILRAVVQQMMPQLMNIHPIHAGLAAGTAVSAFRLVEVALTVVAVVATVLVRRRNAAVGAAGVGLKNLLQPLFGLGIL